MQAPKRLTGLMLATVAAGLFALAPLSSFAGEEGDAGVKCEGGNACKGQSACKTAENACKGKNACKGHGYVMTATAEECTKLGGKVEEMKSE
jgi:hypothetical protein